MMDESLPVELVDRIDRDEFFFMQIGANDGIFWDPIRKWIVDRGWMGIMFEPQPECVQKLYELYETNDLIAIVPYGIAATAGRFKLYEHEYGSGCYSLLLRPDYCKPDAFLEIECITFDDALQDYGIEKIDLLVIDTEGYDLEILDTIDLDTIKPRHIWFENWTHDFDDLNRPDHPTSVQGNQHVIDRYLQAGYELEDYGNNLLLTLGDRA